MISTIVPAAAIIIIIITAVTLVRILVRFKKNQNVFSSLNVYDNINIFSHVHIIHQVKKCRNKTYMEMDARVTRRHDDEDAYDECWEGSTSPDNDENHHTYLQVVE